MGKCIDDIKGIISDGVRNALLFVHSAAIVTYWRVGRRIVEEEQHGEVRAEYGTGLLKGLSEELIPQFGENYSERNLRNYRQFFTVFPIMRFGTHAFQI